MTSLTADEQDRNDMARLVAGQESALDNLMERHGERLFHYLIRSLQNEQDAADLAQETFVRIFQNCGKYNPQLKFSTWLYTIASNQVRDCYRRRTRQAQVSLDAQNEATGHALGETLAENRPIPSETLQNEERATAVRRAVAALPEELRMPLILAEYEELSQAEIGEILGCTTKAVETRIYRAKQQLRAKLSVVLRAE